MLPWSDNKDIIGSCRQSTYGSRLHIKPYDQIKEYKHLRFFINVVANCSHHQSFRWGQRNVQRGDHHALEGSGGGLHWQSATSKYSLLVHSSLCRYVTLNGKSIQKSLDDFWDTITIYVMESHWSKDQTNISQRW